MTPQPKVRRLHQEESVSDAPVTMDEVLGAINNIGAHMTSIEGRLGTIEKRLDGTNDIQDEPEEEDWGLREEIRLGFAAMDSGFDQLNARLDEIEKHLPVGT